MVLMESYIALHRCSPVIPMQIPRTSLTPRSKVQFGILQDAANVASVKRVVVTSSFVTLLEPKEGKYEYSELDWFDTAPKIVEQQGRSASGALKYIASKVLAEHAAWDWMKANNPSFELVTVLPPWKSILADPAQNRPESSNYRLLSAISGAKDGTVDLTETTYINDVLDIAEGHVRALITPGIAGQRFNLLGGSVTWQDTLDYIAAHPVQGLDAPVGQPGSGKSFSEVAEKKMSGEKALKQLGMIYRSPKDTIHDTIAQALEFGWKP
ncbi:hypothetical protein M408DRAFT_318076 [Serendipita vermifera MAFF 305830]|uniref:NAD-dependent epimerase/dehydratase domain-containing protein n=1 Tax=Serendipita vermifera MAFF 305830 TaxID=933852 RepID=A0A0C2X0G7_SERVB|nr:hypothetical protein M408DRAFT_318076 [Serendipita vermifera MAFF 305830]